MRASLCRLSYRGSLPLLPQNYPLPSRHPGSRLLGIPRQTVMVNIRVAGAGAGLSSGRCQSQSTGRAGLVILVAVGTTCLIEATVCLTKSNGEFGATHANSRKSWF